MSSPGRRRRAVSHFLARHWFLTVCLVSITLVAVQWAPFQTRSNFNGETGLVLPSLQGGWQAFVYWGDPVRLFTQSGYHLGFLLNEMLGIPGSPFGYQGLYLLLWIARPILVGIIAIRAFALPLPAALAGVVVASVFGGDDATNWIGQLNQHWFLALACGAAALILVPIRSPGLQFFSGLLASALAFVALWSYEGVLPVVISFVGVALLLRILQQQPGGWLPAAMVLGVVLASIGTNAARFLGPSSGVDYQSSVGRTDWGLGSIASDAAAYFRNALFFWQWGPESGAVLFGWWMALLAVLAGLVALSVLAWSFKSWSQDGLRHRQSDAGGRLAVVLGLAILAFGSAPYLLLADAAQPWRNQFTAGLGLAFLVSGLVALALPLLAAARQNGFRRLGLAAMAVLSACLAGFGVSAALMDGKRFQANWEAHAESVRDVVRAANCVAPNTVVFVALPAGADPFGHSMWMSNALSLAFMTPGVVGVYSVGGELGPGADQPVSPTTAEDRAWISIVEDRDGRLVRSEEIPTEFTKVAHLSAVSAGQSAAPAKCGPKTEFSVRMFGLQESLK